MKRGRKKYNDDVKEDRLSDLPDCVLLHILSRLDADEAVKTCTFSSRWRHLWKHLPTLILCSSHCTRIKSFNRFVSRILCLRDVSTPLHNVEFLCRGVVDPRLLKKVVTYAVSHNVEKLRVHACCDFQHFSSCFFSCHTLTSLDLCVGPPRTDERLLFPKSLNLPALTTLSLESFAFCVGDNGCAEPFSALNSLKNLMILYCNVLDEQSLCISSVTLTNLTIVGDPVYYSTVELSTPSLFTFDFVCHEGIPVLKLCRSKINLSSVKHVNIEVRMWTDFADASLVLLNWLAELANIKSLTLNHTALKVLSLVPDLLKVEFHSLCNLKSLKVKMRIPSSMPNGTLYFLLQNSPSAKVEIVDWRH